MQRSALLLPAHGHAPYLLGVKFLHPVAAEICVPHYYGETQRKILMEEFPGETDHDRIFLSAKLGELFKPLIRNGDAFPEFDAFARSVDANSARVTDELDRLCREGIEAVSLTGAKKKFTHFDLALNTGLPIVSPIRPAFFAFVGKMSVIYQRAPFPNSDVQELSRIWERIESTFEQMFVPRLNTLFGLEYDTTGITFTPPFARLTPFDDSDLPADSALIVTSGTGLDVERLLSLTRSASRPFLTLVDSPRELNLPRVSSNVWGNPNLSAVISRAGLGTIWQALVDRKPVCILKALPRDDPEIYHNARIVEEAGIGMLVDADANGLTPFFSNLQRYRSAIETQAKLDLERFNTLNGLDYTSAQLNKSLLLSAKSS